MRPSSARAESRACLLMLRGHGDFHCVGFSAVWRASPEFVEIRKVGEKYATFTRGFAVDGVPQ